jgi:hypothetical protein
MRDLGGAVRLRRRSSGEKHTSMGTVASAGAMVAVLRQWWRGRGRGNGDGDGGADVGAGEVYGLGNGTAAETRRLQRAAEKKQERRDPNVRLKRVRSAFCVMTGRGGRMTGRGGDSVRSHSSKLLE